MGVVSVCCCKEVYIIIIDILIIIITFPYILHLYYIALFLTVSSLFLCSF